MALNNDNTDKQEIIKLDNRKARRNLLLFMLVVALVTAVYFFYTDKGQALLDEKLGRDSTSQADTVLSFTPQEVYEFGEPIEDLTDPESNASEDDGYDDNPSANDQESVKQKVNTTRAKFNQLKQVDAAYRKHPTDETRERGLKLKKEVTDNLDELTPLAERYNYQEGINEANDMRRQMQKMTFD